MDFQQHTHSELMRIAAHYRHDLDQIYLAAQERFAGCAVEQKHVEIFFQALEGVKPRPMAKYTDPTEEDKQYWKDCLKPDYAGMLAWAKELVQALAPLKQLN